jgi:hypothetical protein
LIRSCKIPPWKWRFLFRLYQIGGKTLDEVRCIFLKRLYLCKKKVFARFIACSHNGILLVLVGEKKTGCLEASLLEYIKLFAYVIY